MGEMADYYLEQTMDMENDRWLYRQGQMSDQDAYDLGIIDHYGRYQHVPMFGRSAPYSRRDYSPSPAKTKTCRLCGKSGLHWGNVKGGHWALFDGNDPHKQTCPAEKF